MKNLIIIMILLFSGSALNAQSYRGVQYVRPEDKLQADYCSDLFGKTDGTILTMNDAAAGYTNILDWMQGRVAGLQVYTGRNKDRVPYIRGMRAAVFVDEMPVDPDFISSLSPFDIAFVKVIKAPFVGSPGNNSAIAIYRLRGFGDE